MSATMTERSVFTPLTSEWHGADRPTSRVRKGRVVVEDDEMAFPLIRLGVSEDRGVEDYGYIREYATLTPAQARKVAAALNRAAKVASAHIRETSWRDDEEEVD